MRTTLLTALLVAGCGTRAIDIGTLAGNDAGVPGGPNAPVDLAMPPGPKPIVFPITESQGPPQPKFDILFMVDNSNSMDAMQVELRKRLPQFTSSFVDLAAKGVYTDLHIGVVTSDYGAGATGAPGCQVSPGGQQGRLQAVGASAPPGCKPPGGANYLAYAFGAGGNDTHNLPPGQGLAATLDCMAATGANGCGFEHQLESVYAALHNGLPENAGFVRDGAVLVVIFVTNEDDSSAPPDAVIFDKTRTAEFGFESSYRQTRWGVVCCPPGMMSCDPSQLQLTPYGDSGGPLAGCLPAPNLGGNGPGKEFDVSRYVDFFTRPATRGGVKADPNDVALVAIDAPVAPVQIILSNPGITGGAAYTQCSPLAESVNPPCVPVLQHSCMNAAQPQFFGDPAVRLNTVVSAAANHSIASICDNDYSGALGNIDKLIMSRMGLGCFTYALARDNSGTLTANCTVEDHVLDNGGGTTVVAIPACGGGAIPCWKVQAKNVCAALSPDGAGIVIDRNGVPPPAKTTAYATCIPPA